MHVIFHTDDSTGGLLGSAGIETVLYPSSSPGLPRNYRAGDEKTKPNLPASATPSFTMRGTEASTGPTQGGVGGPHARARESKQTRQTACWGGALMSMNVNSSPAL